MKIAVRVVTPIAYSAIYLALGYGVVELTAKVVVMILGMGVEG